MGTVLLVAVVDYALFQVSVGRGHLSKSEQDRSQRQVRLQEERRVLATLGQA
jgi:hypothetical protein